MRKISKQSLSQLGIDSYSTDIGAVASARLAQAIGDVRSNLLDGTVLFIGDSNTFGAYSGSDISPTPLSHPRSFASQLADKVSSLIPTSIRARAGDGDAGAALINASDPTIDIGTWGVGPGATIGGKYFTASVTGATMTVTNPEPWDQFELIYVRADVASGLNVGSIGMTGPTSETASVSAKTGVGSSAARLILSRASPASGKVTLTATLGAGESFYIVGWVFRNTKERVLHFVNAGIRGADTGTSNATPLGLSRSTPADYVMRAAINGIWKPQLTFIMVGTNDARSGGLNPGIAVFKSNTQLLIDDAAKTGSVVLLVPPAIAPEAEGPVPFSDYRSAIYDMAKQNGLAVVDFQKVLGTYAESLAAGTQKDTLHPNALGHAKLSEALVSVILSAIGTSPATGDDLRGFKNATKPITARTVADAMAPVVVADAASITLDLSKGTYFVITTNATIGTARTLLKPINAKPGQTFTVDIISDAANRTLAYNTVFKFDGGTVPALTTTAARTDKLICQVYDDANIHSALRKDIR